MTTIRTPPILTIGDLYRRDVEDRNWHFKEEEAVDLQAATQILNDANHALKAEVGVLKAQVSLLRDSIEHSGAHKTCQGLADALASTEPKP